MQEQHRKRALDSDDDDDEDQLVPGSMPAAAAARPSKRMRRAPPAAHPELVQPVMHMLDRASRKRPYTEMDDADEVCQSLSRWQLENDQRAAPPAAAAAPPGRLSPTHVLVSKRRRVREDGAMHWDTDSSEDMDTDADVERFVVVRKAQPALALQPALSIGAALAPGRGIMVPAPRPTDQQLRLYRSPESYTRDILAKAEMDADEAEVASTVVTADRPFIVELPDDAVDTILYTDRAMQLD